jgi:hypothetical protein
MPARPSVPAPTARQGDATDLTSEFDQLVMNTLTFAAA